MRTPIMMVMMVLLAQGIGMASNVDLKDGRIVQGTITKQDKNSVNINVDGVDMTYYADEIKDVDGKPFNAEAAAPDVTPGPSSTTVQPEASPDNIMAPAPVSQANAIDPQKKALILKFIDVFGTRQALNNNFQVMLKQIEKEKPEEAEKIRQRVKIDEIVERLLPVYDRNFSTEDLKTFIAFYTSAEGQKLISTIPALMKESVQASVRYMQEKFPESKGGRT